MNPVYEPANADGLKPYVVTIRRWGKESNRLVWSEDRTAARYEALPRKGVGEYITRVRRASPDDVLRDIA